MSKIAEQIKILQLKQKKVDYISYIIDNLKNDKKCVDFTDVKNEVLSKVEPFLKSLISNIESDLIVEPSQASIEAKNVTVIPPKNNNLPVDPVSQNEKINFALDNRHLGGKKVTVIGDGNTSISGSVVGLDAPFVIVKTDTGPTIKVPLEKVVLN